MFYPNSSKSALNLTKNLPEIKTSDSPELKVYGHGLSPLPMQNPYLKLILGMESLFVNRFSKILLHILRQI